MQIYDYKKREDNKKIPPFFISNCFIRDPRTEINISDPQHWSQQCSSKSKFKMKTPVLLSAYYPRNLRMQQAYSFTRFGIRTFLIVGVVLFI